MKFYVYGQVHGHAAHEIGIAADVLPRKSAPFDDPASAWKCARDWQSLRIVTGDGLIVSSLFQEVWVENDEGRYIDVPPSVARAMMGSVFTRS